ncbi:MAG: hypothetical protein ACE145_06145 [Terriglobia bacterium]
MADIDKARQLFQDAGLAFPTIPEKLALRLRERGEWIFSTRPLAMSPYNLQHYVQEARGTRLKDFAVLAHSGHGVNSYAIQYYLVRGALRMFLHLGWGGVYMNAERSTARIRDCFDISDRIVEGIDSLSGFKAGESLTVVGSNFYGSYWLPPGLSPREHQKGRGDPIATLAEVLDWIKTARGVDIAV